MLNGRSVTLTTHIHIVPRSGMRTSLSRFLHILKSLKHKDERVEGGVVSSGFEGSQAVPTRPPTAQKTQCVDYKDQLVNDV
jgi:hypothetical protein